MKEYYLKPLPEQNQIDFYRKAKVVVQDDGSETLYSYDTPILRKNVDGTYTRLWDSYSTTTGKYIKAFCGMNKKDFDKLQLG